MNSSPGTTAQKQSQVMRELMDQDRILESFSAAIGALEERLADVLFDPKELPPMPSGASASKSEEPLVLLASKLRAHNGRFRALISALEQLTQRIEV